MKTEEQVIHFVNQQKPFCGMLYSNANSQCNLLIAPAMGITARYYGKLANWLCEQGFSVLVIDYQGTGMSESQIRDSITLSDWVKNIEIAGRWLKELYPGSSTVFLGHSIGSQLFGFVSDTLLFDRAVMLASSTGYWQDTPGPRKWVNYFLLNIILPLSNAIWGYTNARFFRQGENYPKLPALQWRKWCMNKEYLEMELDQTQINNYNHYSRKVVLVWFSDDPIANEVTTLKFARLFKTTSVQRIEINPSDVGKSKIGHTGFLSRKYADRLWPEFVLNIRYS